MEDEFCLFKVDEKRVIWEITNYCNYQCKHCCASANKIDTQNELTTEQCFSILDQLHDFGIKEIYFSGGEPFSKKNILDILERATNYGITCNISTNGSYITSKIAKKLKELNINKVHISLDSMNDKSFNNFRGGDYFEPTIKAIKLLKENNLYVRVGAVIWKGNIDELEEMINYFIDLKVNEVVFNWLVKVGRLVENEEVCVPISRFDITTENIRKYKEKYKDKIIISMHRNNKFNESEKICPAGETFFYINPQGYISPCSWIKKMDSEFTPKSSLKDTTFLEIIKSKEIQEFNQMKRKRQELYSTGCPAICKERNQTYYSKDPLLHEVQNDIVVKKEKEEILI